MDNASLTAFLIETYNHDNDEDEIEEVIMSGIDSEKANQPVYNECDGNGF